MPNDDDVKTSFTYHLTTLERCKAFETDLVTQFKALDMGAVPALRLRWYVLDIPPSREAELRALAQRHDIEITSLMHVYRNTH